MSMTGDSGMKRSSALGVALSLASVPNVMSIILLVPIMPKLMLQFRDVTNAIFWVPTLMTLPGLCAAGFAPIAGYLRDRFDKRLLPVTFTLVFSLFGAAPVLLSDFAQIAFTRFIVGICQVSILERER